MVGDCLSNAYGFDVKHSWVTLLDNRLQQQNLPYQIINLSETADTTSNSLEKLPAALKRYKPAIVIIAAGGNDGLRGINVSHIQKNLNAMVELSQQAHAKVLLVSFLIPENYGPIYRQRFESIYENTVNHYHLPEVIRFAKKRKQQKVVEQDNIHLTPEAQPIVFDAIWAKLSGLLTDV